MNMVFDPKGPPKVQVLCTGDLGEVTTPLAVQKPDTSPAVFASISN
jgi:hypothetical protein